MKFSAGLALMLSLFAGNAAVAATCPGVEKNAAICADKGLSALHQAGEARLRRLVAAADPLTALLLRRDQRWSFEMVVGRDEDPFDASDEPARKRKSSLLEERLAALGHLTPGAIPDGISGDWINAFGKAKVEKRGDAMMVEISSSVSYEEAAEEDQTFSCALKAQVKLRPDGWYAGVPAVVDDDDDDDADAPPKPAASGKSELRLRLQGNTLRVLLVGDREIALCKGPETITGSYFLTGAGAGRAGDAAARTVSPSFDCATAKNADEEEICSDPDLAHLDAEIARAYRDTLRRLEPRLAAYLRDDERAWSKGNTGAFDTFLHPYWDKLHYFVTQTGTAREEWGTRLRERLAMLANIDEKRQGFAGHWIAYNAMLSILPDPDAHDGSVTLEGGKWITGSHKQYCDLDFSGQIVGNRFTVSGDEVPKFRRESGTLTIDGDDPDPDRHGQIDRKQPAYCTRLDSAKVRLLPVKPAGYLGHAGDRIR
jgi:uncharacterized protein YecT (DUF1311 family)